MLFGKSFLGALFCVLVVHALADLLDSPEIDSALAPLTKNENVFFNMTTLTPDSESSNKTFTKRKIKKHNDANSNSAGIPAPDVFPTRESNGVKIKGFDERLLHKDNSTNKTVIRTEADDMRKTNKNINLNQRSNLPLKSPSIPDKIDTQAELIDIGENTEDKRILDHHHASSRLGELNQTDLDSVNHGSIAAICIGTLVLLTVLCYVGLLSWRRYLERKYGSRQILVNEEDFSVEDPNDMRHFSI